MGNCVGEVGFEVWIFAVGPIVLISNVGPSDFIIEVIFVIVEGLLFLLL